VHAATGSRKAQQEPVDVTNMLKIETNGKKKAQNDKIENATGSV
jgi:hypothetical protein